MIINEINQQVNVAIRAPSSIHTQLENDINLIDAILDLSSLDSGVHTLTPQVNLGLTPAEVVRINPSSIFIKLDAVVTENFPIDLRLIGNPTIGFEVQTPELSDERVLISGPKSLIDTIDRVVAEINIADVSENIQRVIEVTPFDIDDIPVTGVTINPAAIQVTVPVTQRGGFRTVVVKIVTSGQIAAGYRLTNIFAMPPTVTIFSADPTLVESLPGFIETAPINLNAASEDIEIRVALNLPEGINVVGSQNVTVQIGIDPIQSSISYTNIPIQIDGLGEGLEATLSPENVDIFLSGPLPLLDELDQTNILILIDLSDRGPGTYQLAPEVLLENDQIIVDVILPSSIEVTISEAD
jgi:YbbR domain-containing protein